MAKTPAKAKALKGAHELVKRNPADLRGYAGNARTHSEDQVRQIRAAMDEFGFTNPIALKDDETTVGAGHARLEAALLAPPLKEVPTVVLRGLTEEQWAAYVLFDNKIALSSGWNEQILRLELGKLQTIGFNMSLTGFGNLEIKGLFARSEGRSDPEEAPEPPTIPVSRLGDLWVLGDHRIICGSSTDATTVERVLNHQKPHLMVTDPPYGVEYDADWRNKAMRADGAPIGGRAVGKVSNDDRADWREAWALFPGEVAYIWHAGVYAPVVAESLVATGFEIRSQIIWNKTNFAIGRGDYHWKHEPCWYAVRKGGKGHWAGDRKQTTVWDIAKPAKSETGHSTQKPIDCMRKPIENNSQPGDQVYEPFSGSGTTIIACQMTGRQCFAVELSPAYVDVAVKRWMEFTGQEAALEDGSPWSQIVAARLADTEAV
jgi:DNA modification methylase